MGVERSAGNESVGAAGNGVGLTGVKEGGAEKNEEVRIGKDGSEGPAGQAGGAAEAGRGTGAEGEEVVEMEVLGRRVAPINGDANGREGSEKGVS